MGEISEQEIERLGRELAPIMRQLEPSDHQVVAPPPQLWAAIEQRLNPAVPAISQHRRGAPRRVLVALAVAAAVALIGGVGISLRNGGPASVTVARAALSNESLDPRGAATTGSATVLQREDGLRLQLNVQQPPNPAGTYLEVWMIDRAVQGMVSLGPYSGDGDYPIPNGIDPGQYPIVDVSLEPADGVPTHSKISIVRGVLT
ncbi:MAG: anti-sigma factor [Acidimicrobiales bacterium]